MNDFSNYQVQKFFDSISPWRSAYSHARLHLLGIRTEEGMSIVAARIFLDVTAGDPVKPHFRSGVIEALQWVIPQELQTVEAVIQALVSSAGLSLDGVGNVRLMSDERQEVFVEPPTLLHPEGLNVGNRLAVLTVSGRGCFELVPQPASDWALRAAQTPYDSVQELCFEYGLGQLSLENSKIEVVARTSVQVLGRSQVVGTKSELGIWMGNALDHNTARLGYRVLQNGNVVKRGSFSGAELSWTGEGDASIGVVQMDVPEGAVVQCIASYGEHAQNVQWRADPSTYVNPRVAALGLIDPKGEILRNFLLPEIPLRGKVADDFETGVAWLLWALGFSTATFGTNAKTTEAFDTIAVSPSGDFAVIESTLTLLRADSKLSKLAARSASLRDVLAASNMRHLRVMSVMVTAMTLEQVKVDIPAAEENGILVLTQEDLVMALDNGLFRLPNADEYFNRWLSRVEERKLFRSKLDLTSVQT